MNSTDTAHHEGPAASQDAVALELRNVTKRYPGQDQPAIESLSFEVGAGEICVLVGPSGCGKTTAMRMVNRMIDITSGDILVGGRSVRDRDETDLRRHIGYVIQQIGLFPHRTIADNIATVPQLLGWDKRRTKARVEELLDLIGLPQDMARRYPAQLGRRLVADGVVADEDVALGHLHHAVRHPHRGRLAAAGWADEHADLAGRHLEVEVFDGRGVGPGVAL